MRCWWVSRSALLWGGGAGGSVGQHCEGEGCWWVSRSVL